MNKLLIMSCGSVLAMTVLAGNDWEIKSSREAEAEAGKRREAVQAELSTLTNHPWAGEYYEGDGLGVNVRLFIAPKSGYVFEWRGCLGLYDRNFGAVTVANGRLRLSFAYPNKREGFKGIAEQLVPIRWGERAYLVRPTKSRNSATR